MQWMKITVSALLFAALLFVGATALAAPPCPMDTVVTQPSGEEIAVTQHGDEWFHWAETEDGFVITPDQDGYWCYAVYDNRSLSALDTKAGIDARPEGAMSGEALEEAIRLAPPEALTDARRNAPGRKYGGISAPQGPQKLLVLLISFDDPATTINDVWIAQTDAYWANRMYGDYSMYSTKTNAYSSVNDYFRENSGNAFYFLPAEESSGTVDDSVIRVTLDYRHPDYTTIEANSNMVARDALTKADAYIDYSGFDSDGNGVITPDELHVVMILAGYERSYDGASVNAVWGHSYGIARGITLDGVSVGRDYTQQGEKHGSHPATVGIFAHELGHSLGLPDLYDYGGESMGLGPYSLMAEGSWAYNQASGNYPGSSPTHLDAWCKSLLEFAVPSVRSSGTVDLYSIETDSYNIIKLPTSDPKQYFLLENREVHGYDHSLYDLIVPSGGILCLHVDTSVLDRSMDYYGGWYQVNDDENHKAVDVEEANQGYLNGMSEMDSNTGSKLNSLFRRGTQTCNFSFNSSTTPNSKTYGGAESGVSFQVASANYGPVMSVSVTSYALEITALAADMPSPQITGRAIRWTCSAVGGAGKTYLFEVYRDGILRCGTDVFTASNYFDWVPDEPGAYEVTVFVLASGMSEPLYATSEPFLIIQNAYSPQISASSGGTWLSDGDHSRADVAVTVSDDDNGDVLTVDFCLNGGAPVASWPAGGVFGQEGEIEVRATDLAGNNASFRFTIDKTAPVITATSSGCVLTDGQAVQGGVSVSVADLYLAGYDVTRGGAACTWPLGGLFTEDGLYCIAACDIAGNQAAFRFGVDNAAPVIQVSAGGARITNNGHTRTDALVSVSDATACSVTVLRNGSPCAWPDNGRFAADGVYTIRATDACGRSASYAFTVDKTMPAVSILQTNGAPARTGGCYRAPVTASVSDAHLLSKRATRNGVAVSWPSGGRFALDGAYRVTGMDRAGNASVVAFTVDAARPVVVARALNGLFVPNGGLARRGAVITVVESNLLSRSVKLGARAIAWPAGGRFTAIGTYTVTATDRAGNTAVFRFTVK